MKAIYLVKDLAKAADSSVYTVEFYLKEGLLQEAGWSPDTRYRYFDERAVVRLLEIRRLRRQGLGLKEIRAVLIGERA